MTVVTSWHWTFVLLHIESGTIQVGYACGPSVDVAALEACRDAMADMLELGRFLRGRKTDYTKEFSLIAVFRGALTDYTSSCSRIARFN